MGNNFTPKSYELYFLGIPSDSATDAVQCIAYQVRFENPLTGSGTKNRIMGLFRAKSTPRATILNGYKLVTKDQAPASNDGLVDFMDSSDRYVNTDSSDEQHASNLKNASNLLLSDVYSLQFIPYYWDNNNNITYSGTLGNPEPLNNGQIFAITAQNAASLDGDMNRRLAYMDVILTLLTKNGASFVRQKGNYSAIQDPPSQQAEAWIRQNTQTFSRRISFQGELFQSTDNP